MTLIVDMIINHLRKIRARPEFADSLIVVRIESNNSWISSDSLKKELHRSEFEPMLFETSSVKGLKRLVARDGYSALLHANKIGKMTTNEVKKTALGQLQRSLASGALVVYRNFVSENPEKIQTDLITQMSLYRLEVKEQEDLFSRSSFKMGGKAPGRKDDLAWVVQMCLLQMFELSQDSSFLALVDRAGIVMGG